MEKVLVAVDGYAASQGAAKKAVELAIKYGAELIAVQVEEESLLLEGEKEADSLANKKYLDQISERPLDLIAEYGKEKNLEVKTIKTTGIVAGTILKLAKEHSADFIVVGDSARKGLEKMHFGSVAESIVKESPVPVLVVKRGTIDISDMVPLAKELKGIKAKEVVAPPVFNDARYRKNFAKAFTLLIIFVLTYFGAALLTTAEFKNVAAFTILGVPLAVLLGMLVFVVGLGVTKSYLKRAAQ